MTKNQIFALISKLRRDSSRFLEKEMGEMGMEGLLPSHGAILGVLYRRNGKLRMKEIADLTQRDKSTITFLIKTLTQLGYVTREKSDQDSRETYIALTGKAWAAQDNFRLISDKLIATAYEGFTEHEQQLLLSLLKRLDENFNE